MLESYKENISREVDFFGISIAKNTSVLIIGGGKAALIKARSLTTKGINVTVIGEKIEAELECLRGVTIIKKKYYKEIITRYHIIIIAINNHELRREIIKHCNEAFKIYIDCTDYKNGLAIMQSQGELKNIMYSVNTKVAVPKLSKLLLQRIKDVLLEYDDFVLCVSKIRNEAKNLDNESKKVIIDYICSEDFKFFFDKGKEKLIIKMFFDKEIYS